MRLPRALIGLLAGVATGLLAAAPDRLAAERPKRAILFVIDGLHWQAPEKLRLENLQALARQGASFKQAWLVPPAHPQSGAWAEIHNSSIPNPVMLAGTVFIQKRHRMVQHQFFPHTAHVNNCPDAYVSLNVGNAYIQAMDTEDAWAVDQAVKLLQSEPIHFMRIHLQDTGRAGYACSKTEVAEPYRQNIWGDRSPYVEKAKEADRLLGRFVGALRKMNKYDDTLLVVTADHGQASTGWHPPHVVESAITPLVFVGPGIVKGKVLPYAEHIDIVPTICHMMAKDSPNANGGAGRVLSEILLGTEGTAPPRRQYMRELNEVLCEYLALTVELEKRVEKEPAAANVLAESKEKIYDVDRFLAWPEAGTVDRLIDHNRKVAGELRTALAALLEAPRPAPVVVGEGHRPLKPGTVRLWDANKKYIMKHYDMRAWQDRANWSQVPYDSRNYQFRGDPLLEGENFWISLHSSRHDSLFLYAKTDAEATPGRHNELYRVFDTPTGLRNYGSGSQACRILKNTPEEIIVESESIAYERGGFQTTVTTRYRLLGGKPWVEIQPVSQADEQGMHGESRFMLAPEGAENGSDFVDDSLRRPGEYVCRVSNRAKMLLDLIMDDDTIWVLTCGKVPEGTKLNWPGTRFYAGNAPGGWHAGWSRIGEGDCDRVWTAPFALFAGRAVHVGVLRIGYWHYQRVRQDITKGQPVTVTWRIAYERQIRASPFQPGGPWHPLYPGRWRLVASIAGHYYTVPFTVTVAQVSSTSLTFDSPATGELEYVVFYLYDRTEETPKQVWTPMDICRGVMGP